MGKKRKIKEEFDEQSTSKVIQEIPSKKFKKTLQMEKMDNEFFENFNSEIAMEEGTQDFNQDNSTGKIAFFIVCFFSNF